MLGFAAVGTRAAVAMAAAVAALLSEANRMIGLAPTPAVGDCCWGTAAAAAASS